SCCSRARRPRLGGSQCYGSAWGAPMEGKFALRCLRKKAASYFQSFGGMESGSFVSWAVPAAGQAAGRFVAFGLIEERADHAVVENPDTAARDRSHREFLVSGHADLADHERVESGAQPRRDLVGDRDATARQPEHHDPFTRAHQVTHALAQDPTRFTTIVEHGHDLQGKAA